MFKVRRKVQNLCIVRSLLDSELNTFCGIVSFLFLVSTISKSFGHDHEHENQHEESMSETNNSDLLIDSNHELMYDETTTITYKNQDSEPLLLSDKTNHMPVPLVAFQEEKMVVNDILTPANIDKETLPSPLIQIRPTAPDPNDNNIITEGDDVNNSSNKEKSNSWSQALKNIFMYYGSEYKGQAQDKTINKAVTEIPGSKYRLVKRPKKFRPIATTEAIPDEFLPDEWNTVTENLKIKPTPKPDNINVPVRRSPLATFKNGTKCPSTEESYCWSDGNCAWFEICKSMHCVTQCYMRKGIEWTWVRHNNVGIYPRQMIIVQGEKEEVLTTKRPVPKVIPVGKNKVNMNKNKGKLPTKLKNKAKTFIIKPNKWLGKGKINKQKSQIQKPKSKIVKVKTTVRIQNK